MRVYGYALGKLVKKVLVKKGHFFFVVTSCKFFKNVMAHYFQTVLTYV